jgi:hypothetical protein
MVLIFQTTLSFKLVDKLGSQLVLTEFSLGPLFDIVHYYLSLLCTKLRPGNRPEILVLV